MFGSSQWMYNSGSEYIIEQSLRFDEASNSYLYRTPTTQGNRKTWTFSTWFKRNGIGTNDTLFTAQPVGGKRFAIYTLDTSLYIDTYDGTYYVNDGAHAIYFRDPAAWYHLVVSVDTDNDNQDDRLIVYLNGARVPMRIEFPKGYEMSVNATTFHGIGVRHDGSNIHRNLDGYMADTYFIDGQALDADYFGEINEDYGHWVAKEFSGSYGTNGFYLDYSGTFNNDKSGNGNNFTANNLASTDVVIDSPNNNFATGNSLQPTSATLSEGGLAASYSYPTVTTATFGMTTGKWYWEVEIQTSNAPRLGIWKLDGTQHTPTDLGNNINSWAILNNSSRTYHNGSTASYGTFDLGAGDVIGFAYDADAGKLWVSEDGSFLGDPVAGTSPAFSGITGTIVPAMGGGSGSMISKWNFGQDSSFAGQKTRQNNTDSGGIGDFYYTPPTGYKALCSANLPEPAVKPKENFNTVLYAGNGSSQTINGVGFQSDFSWIKRRNGSGQDHVLQDIVRGFTSTTKLSSSSDQGENDTTSIGGAGITDPQWGYISSVTSDGLNVTVGSGSGDQVNRSGMEYIAWNWKAGGSGVSNTSGNVTSTVSANPNAGFSIVTYTGNANNGQTIGHGLGTTPDWIIVKKRTNASPGGLRGWAVYSSKLPTDNVLRLNSQSGAFTEANFFREDLMSNSVFGVNADYDTGWSDNYVAYCFSEREGFSKVGKYIGNGSADGPFIHCGFRPAFVLIKRQNTTQSWVMVDNKRSAYNPGGETMFADATDGEYESLILRYTDFTANGFKIRAGAGTERNDNGSTYAFIAFAEQPFKYANARGTSYDKETGVAPTELTISQSLRFNFDSGSYLYRTPAGSGNRRTFTISGWIKRGNTGSGYYNYVMGASDFYSSGWFDGGLFISSDRLRFTLTSSARNGVEANVISEAQLRDPSSWYHVMVAVDTTLSTASERVKLYINGERVTALSAATYPAQNFQAVNINNSSSQHRVGAEGWTSYNKSSGLLADVYFVDGQALGPERFGYHDLTYGDWRPRSYGVDGDGTPEANYGANGFRLTFNSGSARIDQSGMGNHFSVANFSESTDVVLDSPSNNFATLNPLHHQSTSSSFAEGNLKSTIPASSSTGKAVSGLAVNSGKWYWETRLISTTSSNAGYLYVGLYSDDGNDLWAIRGSDGERWDNGSPSSATSARWTTGDIVSVAVDMDNGKWYVATNGVWQNGGNGTGNPTAGTGYIHTGISGTLHPYWYNASSTGGHTFATNFGQDSSFAGAVTSQGNQDSNGEGDFYYTPPAGFLALSNNNLPNPTVVPKEHFNTMLYTGDGSSSKNITGVGFDADFVWIKQRSGPYSHVLGDAVRGDNVFLSSNGNGVEETDSTKFRTFITDGFQVGSHPGVNSSGSTYVSWNWKAGGTAVTNTDGSSTATVSANTDAGFSIIKWNGINTATSYGHGLNKAPELTITKALDNTGRWITFASVFDTTLRYSFLNENNAFTSYSPVSFTSTVINTDGGGTYDQNYSGSEMITYAFHSVDGFSKIGKYTGNGSTNGAFVYTGFQPAFVMVKSYTATEHWNIPVFTSGFNGAVNTLSPNLSNAERAMDQNPAIDFLSNGFKIRTSDANYNGSGGGYVYMAFAENPFKRTNSR